MKPEYREKEFDGFKIAAMKSYEINERRQAAADVLSQYSKFALACLGTHARPVDLRLHLMREVSGLLKEPTTHEAPSPDVMGESSSSGTCTGRAL